MGYGLITRIPASYRARCGGCADSRFSVARFAESADHRAAERPAMRTARVNHAPKKTPQRAATCVGRSHVVYEKRQIKAAQFVAIAVDGPDHRGHTICATIQDLSAEDEVLRPSLFYYEKTSKRNVLYTRFTKRNSARKPTSDASIGVATS